MIGICSFCVLEICSSFAFAVSDVIKFRAKKQAKIAKFAPEIRLDFLFFCCVFEI